MSRPLALPSNVHGNGINAALRGFDSVVDQLHCFGVKTAILKRPISPLKAFAAFGASAMLLPCFFHE
jgi:hypothetical protein